MSTPRLSMVYGLWKCQGGGVWATGSSANEAWCAWAVLIFEQYPERVRLVRSIVDRPWMKNPLLPNNPEVWD